jgi:outer membrane protein assembly factor BamD (BamD/ComL family)
MTRILTIIALLFATPVWAAGSYSYEQSASKLINDAKKLIKKEKYKRAIGKLEKAKKKSLIMRMFSIIWALPTAKSATMKIVKFSIKRPLRFSAPK